MQKFLLLRNNKETGPYSVEELEQMGLKPYDLIWVNGKSAAWRYPGEIDELKSFAPPVEEQPYDRFYKKPSEEKQKKSEAAKIESTPIGSNGSSNGNGNGNGSGNGNSNSVNYTPSITPSPQKKEKEYKRVFVTLPNTSAPGKNLVTEQPPIKEVPALIESKIKEPVPSVSEKQKPQKIEAYLDGNSGHSSIDIYYTKRKSFYSSRSFLITAFAIGIIALVALGMFIGVSLKTPNRDAGKQETEKVYRVTEKETKPADEDINQKASFGSTDVQARVPVAVVDSPAITPGLKKIKNPRTNSLKLQLKDMEQKSVVKPIDSSALNLTPQKNDSEKKIPEKNAPNLSKLVTVSNNDFQVGPFGGISKLELTVHNGSELDLDLVVVDLEYLKVNKDVYKTETLYFKDVAANSSITVSAPKSSRGNKINYKISLISSKDRLYHASSD